MQKWSSGVKVTRMENYVRPGLTELSATQKNRFFHHFGNFKILKGLLLIKSVSRLNAGLAGSICRVATSAEITNAAQTENYP
tara:strand:- start:421 stop:666 length:246 start_codon:yes stop_codon:yes gene_type:complete